LPQAEQVEAVEAILGLVLIHLVILQFHQELQTQVVVAAVVQVEQ
jgi:hypothetical protein